MTHRPLILLLTAACSVAACGDDGGSDDPSAGGTMDTMDTMDGTETMDTMDTMDGTETMDSDGATVDEAAIVERALMYATFEQITAESQPSQHGIPDTVNVWAPSDVAGMVRDLADGTVFPPDTIIVKEHLDGSGAPIDVTVMFKGPEGYSPDSGDWWFGLVGLNGNVTVGGQPGACIGCHQAAADTTDWVLALE